jgi:hypothetical protein
MRKVAGRRFESSPTHHPEVLGLRLGFPPVAERLQRPSHDWPPLPRTSKYAGERSRMFDPGWSVKRSPWRRTRAIEPGLSDMLNSRR